MLEIPQEILNSPDNGVEYANGLLKITKSIGTESNIVIYGKSWDKLEPFYRKG